MAEGKSPGICDELSEEQCQTVTILSIPEEILDTILSFLTFNEVSEIRPVRLHV